MKNLIIALFLIGSVASSAQDFLGYRQSTLSGVSSIELNPSYIADSRLAFDANLFSIFLHGHNNHVTANRKEFMSLLGDGNSPNAFTESYNGNLKRIHYMSGYELPSFMFSMKNRGSIALTLSLKNYYNIDGLNDDMLHLYTTDFNYPSLYGQQLTIDNFSFQRMSWMESGITYAGVILDEDEHILSGGGRLNLLHGIRSLYFNATDISYNVIDSDSMIVTAGSVAYGHSQGYDNTNPLELGFSGDFGVGIDLGFNYEWRPNHEDYKYDMDGEEDLWDRGVCKYKLKAGIALNDLGGLSFSRDQRSSDFDPTTLSWLYRDFVSTPPGTMLAFNDSVKNNFDLETSEETYFMNLPTNLNLHVDYRIKKNLFIGGVAHIAFQRDGNANRVKDISNYSITPRWEIGGLGVSMPISYNTFEGFRSGLMLRAGPLFIGTSDLRPLVAESISGGSFYFGLKIFMRHKKPKDQDNDAVSAKFDECPEIAGVWDFKGCPDTDGDKIPDALDECPAEAGSIDRNGCPDTDGDGILDKEDDCPALAGTQAFNGCPDTDGDGVKDEDDTCPELAGLVKFNGCPDTDEDGIVDYDDNCPTEAGPASHFGCPEKVRIHLVDEEGNIVATAVIGENGKFVFRNLSMDQQYMFLIEGDALEDELELIIKNVDGTHNVKALMDGTGYFVYRPLENGFEPSLSLVEEEDAEFVLLKEEEKAVVQEAKKELEFSTGKATIKTISYAYLNELVKLLKENPSWKVRLSGHTDNVGEPSRNLMLSKKRADAVKFFIESRGIDSDKIVVKFYGQNKPIADNNTSEGRQQNRRVEMEIIK